MKNILLINEDLNIIINCCQTLPAYWRIIPYFDDEDTGVCYEIVVSTEAASCHILFFRTLLQSIGINHHVEVLQLNAPPVFHGGAHLKDVLYSWITFGLNSKSTVYRLLKQSVLFLRAVEAEAQLMADIQQRNEKKVCPPGLLVIHNTRAENVESIIDSGGLSLKFAQSGKAIWTRPPSCCRLENTKFTGKVSLIIDAGGLCFKSADSYAVVIGEEIPIGRVLRVCDIDEKTD